MKYIEKGFFMKPNTLIFKDSTTLITGGTGSFGRHLAALILDSCESAKVVIYSRDEYKQYVMRQEFLSEVQKGRLRFVIGDVRNIDRLMAACQSVDYIFHAAALKQVPSCEENIEEAILTNIIGAINVKRAAERCGVRKVVALSTDKAVLPVNLYGATKMASDKIFTDLAQTANTICCIVRYGNVAFSRGSVIPYFLTIHNEGSHMYPVTDPQMTRFWITLSEAASLALIALCCSRGGETFVARIPSFSIVDLVTAIDPQADIVVTGIRPGEKLHETMITQYDAPKTVETDNCFIIYPTTELAQKSGYPPVAGSFSYSSNTNDRRLKVNEIGARLKQDADSFRSGN